MPNSHVKNRTSGLCTLTKQHGTFVKSHIIPASLTRLPSNGKKIVQAGIGHGVKNRFVGWYDNELVTRAGEDILEKIDTPAIELLRMHKFIWSSWGTENRLETGDIVSEHGLQTFRFTQIPRARELQLFFLSLVWRAAVSQRPDFSYVQISPDLVEDLRCRIHSMDPGVFGDYPVQLFQIISKGTMHNRVPLLEKTNIELESGISHEMEYVRIYFDGLVARVHLALSHRFDKRYLSACLRSAEKTIIICHEFEDSRAASDIKEMVASVVTEGVQAKGRLTAIAQAVRNVQPN